MAYDTIRLEKGMYHEAGKSFSQVLEQLDPSENYRGTSLEGLDAFQRQLKRFDIHVKGLGSDRVEKFFTTLDSAALFPEYIARTVRAGMQEDSILPALTATTTRIDAMDYRSVYAASAGDELAPGAVEEGALIPATVVKTKDHLVKLYKRGRMLVASYEAVRFQKLDLFGVMLKQMGAAIEAAHVADAIDVLQNGDGNSNAATALAIGTSPIGGTSGTLDYDSLVDFWAQFHPYQMNTMLVGSGVMASLLKLDELQNPLTGLNFQGTGTLTSPLGATLVRSDAAPSGKIIGLDRRYALEQVVAGDLTVDYDKLMDRQLERAAVTSIAGFAKICTDAAKVLTI